MAALAVDRRREADEEEIFRLYRDVFGHAMTDASQRRWAWQYRENPHAPGGGAARRAAAPGVAALAASRSAGGRGEGHGGAGYRLRGRVRHTVGTGPALVRDVRAAGRHVSGVEVRTLPASPVCALGGAA